MKSSINVSANNSENLTKDVKKEWAMPELLLISKEEIQASFKTPANDGHGVSTGS